MLPLSASVSISAGARPRITGGHLQFQVHNDIAEVLLLFFLTPAKVKAGGRNYKIFEPTCVFLYTMPSHYEMRFIIFVNFSFDFVTFIRFIDCVESNLLN